MTADLAQRILAGDRKALSRGLRMVEDRAPGWDELLRELAPATGRAHRVGVTGPPGAGKSSLIAALVKVARSRDVRVGVLAVDPSSPQTGGALLGDRIRMAEHFLDPGVFVRSMASRGALGGLGAASGAASDLLDAAGFDLLLMETAGAGQTDVDVAGEVETTLVVLAPGVGDGIQALKSGLMEIADLWVVGKADQAQASAVQSQVLEALALRADAAGIQERVLLVSAQDGSGIPELLDALSARLADLEAGGRREALRRGRALGRLRLAARESLDALLVAELPAVQHVLEELLAGRVTAPQAAARLLGQEDGGLK